MMARPKHHRSKDDIRSAVHAYMRGDLMDDIAHRFNVRQPSVSYWMRVHGKKYGGANFRIRTKGRRANKAPNERDRSIIALVLLQGWSFSEVGRKFGITRSRVEFICRTWHERGYRPNPPVKVSDIVRKGESLFQVSRVDDETKGAAVEIDTGKIHDPFRWINNGEPVVVVKVCGQKRKPKLFGQARIKPRARKMWQARNK